MHTAISGIVANAEFLTPVWHSSHLRISVCTLWLNSKGCSIAPEKNSYHRKATINITSRTNRPNKVFLDFVII
jgi:hypothetical protein